MCFLLAALSRLKSVSSVTSVTMHVLPLFVLLQLSRRFASLIKIILLTVYLDFLTDSSTRAIDPLAPFTFAWILIIMC